jgi:hypothetical protein
MEKISAKLPSGNAKFDRLATHPQTPGLLVGLTSNLNIDRGKSEENKKKWREGIHKMISTFKKSAIPT